MIPLIVDMETEWRGGQNQAYLLLKGLYERGHPAELLTAEGSSLGRRANDAGIMVHRVKRGLLWLPAAARIRSLLSGGRIELLHANEAHAVTAAWLAGARRKVPFLISRRVGYPIGRGFVAQARYRAADWILANSHWVAEQAGASGVPRGKLRVVYEGAEIPPCISAAERAAAREFWGVNEHEMLYGCASVFVAGKGQEHALGGLAEVRKSHPKARLLLAGEGEKRAEMEALAARLGLTGAVLFPGFVAEMPNFYRALDAFVFPSEFEALGTTLQAAMAYGLPCISTVNGGMREMIEDGRTGIVAGPNALEFAAAMSVLAGDAELRRRLGDAARAEVIEKFSAEGMVENTLAVYEEVLGMSGTF